MALANPIRFKEYSSAPETDHLVSHAGRAVTEAEYWEKYYDNDDFIYEWNNGILEEKPVGDYAQYTVYLWFLHLLKDFLYVTNRGRMIGLEMGFRLSLLGLKTVVRRPDLAVVASTNPIPLVDKDPSYKGIFDLCVESLSTTNKKNIERDTVTKLQEYQDGGVREYFILDEGKTRAGFYTLNPAGVYVPIVPTRGIINSKVLPGFRFRIADLYKRPEPPEMIEDRIYQDFVSPHLRAERIRAQKAELEAERQRTEVERQRTEVERQRTEVERQTQKAAKFEAMLRKLGVNPNDLE